MWSLQAPVPGCERPPHAKPYQLTEAVCPEESYLLHPDSVRLEEEVGKLKVFLGHVPWAAITGGRGQKQQNIIPFLNSTFVHTGKN